MAEPADTKPSPEEIEFHLEKGNHFRVIHVDGAIGGITPQGGVHMAVYSERAAIPRMLVHKLEDGKLGKELEEKRVVRPGIFRELEADLIFSVVTAVAIRDWLNDKIQTFEKLVAERTIEKKP